MTSCVSSSSRETTHRSLRPWTFIPTPGDHYSPRTGSANINRIVQLARRYIAAGGAVRVIVGQGTMDGYTDGQVKRVAYDSRPRRMAKCLDMVFGRLGFDRPFAVREYVAAAQALRKDEEGVVFVYNNPAGAVAVRRHCPRARVVLYLGNTFPASYAAREVRRLGRLVTRVICVSRYVQADLERRFGQVFDSEVVLNGVDLEQFHPASQEPVGGPVILFVGRMLPEKGGDRLIAAVRRLHETGRRFQVRMVGSENFSATAPLTAYERSLREAAKPLGTRVTFDPFTDRDRIAEVYREAHVFCAPCRWNDPCPNTVLEAMASGLPVVASRLGGIPELTGDAALLWEDNDVGMLASLLDKTLDAAVRRPLAEAARRRAEALSWDRQYRRLVEAVEQPRLGCGTSSNAVRQG